MATTTNYGWETPDDTDLVKDGALAIRTLGSSIDTTTKNLNPETTTGDISYRSATANTNTRLPIGSTGQVLTVAAGVPSWATPTVGDITEVQAGTGISVASGTGPIPVITNTVATAFDAAGDLVYGTAADTFTKLGIGTAGQILTVNSGATAPEWATPASSGGWTELATANLPTNANTVTISSISGSYRMLVVMMRDFYATDNEYLLVRFNGDTNQNYGQIAWYHSAENTVSNNANGINGAIEPNLDSFLNAQRDNFFYLQIPDYANTTTHKSGTFNGKARNSADTYNMNLSGTFNYASTSAISSVTLATNVQNWAGGSYIVYGVK